MIKILILSILTVGCNSYIYSSFWAPLFDRRIINYRIDANFDPEAAKMARESFMRSYGYRGETLIADLGNGRKLSDSARDNKVYGDVKFYYTFPEADRPTNL